MIAGLPHKGALCGMMYPTECYHINKEPGSGALIMPGSYFVFLEAQEINELNSIECTILINNCKMWFNVRMKNNIILNVRGVESYDIPFTTVAYA